MKKLLLLLIVGGYGLPGFAQQVDSAKIDSVKKYAVYHKDSVLSHWAIDVNLLGGGLSEKYTTANTANNYPSGVNVYPGTLKFTNGTSFGFDAEVAYFFGNSNNFGIGVGLGYLAQSGKATLDSFHAEYKATDKNGQVYRQVVTTDQQIQEKMKITNMNIPILLKYKNRFSEHWGFTADAGALINLQIKNAYTTNASFDYEAIYEYQGAGTTATTLYDPSSVPNGNDVLITKAHFYSNTNGTNTYSTVQDYFAAQQKLGENVGLNVKPTSGKGNVSYLSGSIGLLIRPALNYYLSDNIALTGGFYYLYQPFKSNAQNGYELTNGMGNYTSVLRSVSAAPAQSYGLNLGVRIYFGKPKDTDGDGVPDKKDRCPLVCGLEQFQGCPDTDGDGIPDPDDSCPTVAGLIQFHGCPDSDSDGIQDKDDSCPYQAGLAKFHGCPDRDGDGIPDKEDACPDVPGLATLHGCPDRDGDGIPDKDDACPGVAGLAAFHGCPDTDGDGIPDKDDNCPTVAGPPGNHGCPVDTPKPEPVLQHTDETKRILFEVNNTVIRKSSYATLQETMEMMKSHSQASVEIEKYIDSKDSKKYNKTLSLKRAKAVKARLVKMGVNAKRIKIDEYDSKLPATSHKAVANNSENRGVIIHLSVSDK